MGKKKIFCKLIIIRCMAISVAVLVGESKKLIPKFVEKANNLKLGAGNVEGTDVSPLAYSEVSNKKCLNFNFLYNLVKR